MRLTYPSDIHPGLPAVSMTVPEDWEPVQLRGATLAVIGLILVATALAVAHRLATDSMFGLFAVSGVAVAAVLGALLARAGSPRLATALAAAALSIAVLSFLGFDGIATLSEEAKGGRRSAGIAMISGLILVATFFVTASAICATVGVDGSRHTVSSCSAP